MLTLIIALIMGINKVVTAKKDPVVESPATMKLTEDMIKELKQRRGWKEWAAKDYINNITSLSGKPNILVILADDLGYGDTSVYPFTFPKGKNWPCDDGGILTPELEKMASKGVIMTNFHSAAPVCSPARAALMTGLYSYRLNALNAFELGRDLSQRNGFLPQIPTIAEIFRQNGYFTAHLGKWHLGGMREENRKARLAGDCSRPGPNQHGFEEYVSMLDGPESPRYTFLNRESILHSQGHNYFMKDDILMPNTKKNSVLSDEEANEAIRVIRESASKRPGQPWYIQLWFNAPHGPWELLPTGHEVYEKATGWDSSVWKSKKCWAGNDRPQEPILEQRMWQYKTMVTAMDKSIGAVLSTLKELGLEEKTLVVFTSDNGMERGAGTAGGYKEGKRSLMEGGIRVPTIIQWTGTIPANESNSAWGAHTDLIPTFLEAAGIPRPPNVNFDGLSILPLLKQRRKVGVRGTRKLPLELQKRVYLWHRDTEPYDGYDGRINSAGYFEHIKVITRENSGSVYKIFDMKSDPMEKRNLLINQNVRLDFNSMNRESIQSLIRADENHIKCPEINATKLCHIKYHEHTALKIRFILSKLSKFVQHGNDGHSYYMEHLEKKAICKVPIVTEVPILPFGDRNCTSCTYPEY